MKYSLLLGYGLFNKSNLIYKQYLDNFASFVNKENVEVVVISGGHTDPKRPSESEAGTISKYLENKINKGTKICLRKRH